MRLIGAYSLGVMALMWSVAALAHEGEFEAGQLAYEAQEYRDAYNHWQPLAQAGDSRAQNGLALLYLNGEGVRRNYFTAFDLFYRAASEGSAEAQYQLGLMYLQGLGVSQSYRKAMRWFKRAARHGSSTSQLYVDELLRRGLGLRRLPFSRDTRWSKYG